MSIPVFSASNATITMVMVVSTFVSLATEPGVDLDAVARRVVRHRSQELIELSKSKEVIEAVKNQNKQKVSATEIQKRDQLWQEATQDETRLSMLDGDMVQKIKKFMLNKRAVYGELILTDEVGANVACYPLSSDYFQGDEEKFTKPYHSGEIYYGQADYDKSSGINAIQISVPVKQGQETIGVLIAGIKLSYTKARSHGYK